MDALLEQLHMVRTFVTNMHPNLRMQLAHRPMPGALLLGASTLAFLPHAGLMTCNSRGICVIKVSYHKHVCFFDKCFHLLAEWISDFYGIDFPRRAFRGMVFRACLRNGFPSHFLQRNGFRSGFGNIILLAYTDGYSIPPSTDGLRHDLWA